MDKDKDARLTYDEFVEGSKLDPTIVKVSLSALLIFPFLRANPVVSSQALSLYDGLV
jgi:hypothetical protein